jgi:hypothetical protein
MLAALATAMRIAVPRTVQRVLRAALLLAISSTAMRMAELRAASSRLETTPLLAPYASAMRLTVVCGATRYLRAALLPAQRHFPFAHCGGDPELRPLAAVREQQLSDHPYRELS